MAKFYGTQEFYATSGKICLAEPQLNVLLYIMATQVCKMDDPQYGCLALAGAPSGGEAEWIVTATMCRGDFCLEGTTGRELAEQSIGAAVDYPDVDSHYAQMAPDGGILQGNAYFDENLSVLVLAASHGRLMLALQLSLTDEGEEYAKEHFLKAYAAATITLQRMMPKDEILQNSCVTALSEILQQYRNCMCCNDLFGDLNWIKEMFARGRQDGIYQWKLWQEEHPEIKTYFRDK